MEFQDELNIFKENISMKLKVIQLEYMYQDELNLHGNILQQY